MKVACNFDNTNGIFSSVVQILPPPSGTPSLKSGRVIAPLGCQFSGGGEWETKNCQQATNFRVVAFL